MEPEILQLKCDGSYTFQSFALSWVGNKISLKKTRFYISKFFYIFLLDYNILPEIKQRLAQEVAGRPLVSNSFLFNQLSVFIKYKTCSVTDSSCFDLLETNNVSIWTAVNTVFHRFLLIYCTRVFGLNLEQVSFDFRLTGLSAGNITSVLNYQLQTNHSKHSFDITSNLNNLKLCSIKRLIVVSGQYLLEVS